MGNKKSKKKETIPMSSKTKLLIGVIITVIVVGIFGLIIVEQINKEKIRIVNNTDKNISSLRVMFETEDESEELISLYDGELKSGAKYSGSYKNAVFPQESDIGMYVTFEGENEIYMYDGVFNDRYDGNIDIEFFQAEGQYRVKMSATTGLFKDAGSSAMKDDIFYFDFEESDFWDINDYWEFDESDDSWDIVE